MTDLRVADERNRYFTGKYMAPRDFMADPDYLLARHRMHNRLLHGWGIVTGLQVRRHPRPECADRWVRVKAGIAVDCLGRELVLHRDEAVELPPPAGTGDDHEFFVCLAYTERPIEYVPVLYHENGCEPGRSEANRVREVATVQVLTADEFRRHQRHRRRDGCHRPACPCGHLVPLARVVFPGRHGKPFRIDRRVRRHLGSRPARLTHIAKVNWPHGGEITLSDLDRVLGRTLEITFDRRLRRGINGHTFVVQYRNLQDDLEFLRYRVPPQLTGDRRHARFVINDAAFDDYRNLRNNEVLVTLKCDFVLDCHDVAVDGNHIGGRRPSGNGVPGGTFESWFRVV
ncbi:hypothetical protein AB0M02_32840 [Actinoplanes sp. NPDC051861]|uniref:hypothetical protein n=1 Tax=Actinoplanes sp. NPDC051861 TaxID=3155170 RepID=UPI0034452D0A